MFKNKKANFVLTSSALLLATYFGVESWKVHFFNKFFLKIPNLQGYTLSEVENLAEKYHFKIEKNGEAYSLFPKGIVFKQNPVDGVEIKRGNIIKVFVSRGMKKNLVPDCSSLLVSDAVHNLSASGIKINKKLYDENPMFENERVIATDPPVGYESMHVKLLISGHEMARKIFVPDVVGVDIEIAKKSIEKAGLQIGKVEGSGYVKKTKPEAFVESSSGSFIDIFAD